MHVARFEVLDVLAELWQLVYPLDGRVVDEDGGDLVGTLLTVEVQISTGHI